MEVLKTPEREVKKCAKCKVGLPDTIEYYRLKRSGISNRTCNHCLLWSKNFYKKNKCEHGKYKYTCLSCANIKK